MKTEDSLARHYTHGNLIESIKSALIKMGKSPADVSVDELAAVDEFHIGGRGATEHLLKQLPFTSDCHVLDVGCGLGGSSRYLANRNQQKVTGIDLTEEYVNTGNQLSTWVGLESSVKLCQGSALELFFNDETFDGAMMFHVGMNISDKSRLFSEVARTLKQGATFAIYDVMRISDGELAFPVPWASDPDDSFVASIREYELALVEAGFSVQSQSNRRDFALDFFQTMKKKTAENGGAPPLGLHTLIGASMPEKFTNMIANINNNYIAPVELIVIKK